MGIHLGWTDRCLSDAPHVLLVVHPLLAHPARNVSLPACCWRTIGIIFALMRIADPVQYRLCDRWLSGTLALALCLPASGRAGTLAPPMGAFSRFFAAYSATPRFRAPCRWFVRHPPSAARPLRSCRSVDHSDRSLGAIFVLIFAIANPIVERWTHSWPANGSTDWIEPVLSADSTRSGDSVDRCVGHHVCTAARLAQTAPSIHRHGRRSTGATPAAPDVFGAGDRRSLSRCLLVFNLVFAVETALDLVYLWGGRTLPAGLNYKGIRPSRRLSINRYRTPGGPVRTGDIPRESQTQKTARRLAGWCMRGLPRTCC